MASKRKDELKALEGLRQARIAKYSKALLKKDYEKKKKKEEVKRLDEEKKNVENYKKSESKKKIDDWANGSMSSLTKSPSKQKALMALSKKTKEELGSKASRTVVEARKNAEKAKRAKEKIKAAKQAVEKTAKTDLAALLDKDGEASVKDMGFQGVRGRYMQALEECKPKTLVFSHLTEDLAAQKKREARREQALKKDRYVRIRGAWDVYEDAAQDRPAAASEEQQVQAEEIQQKENEINTEWVGYAKKVVEEIAADEGGDDDDEDDDEDLAYWIAEAKRMKAEAEARRKAKLAAMEARLREEEDEAIFEEALLLRAANRKKKKRRRKPRTKSTKTTTETKVAWAKSSTRRDASTVPTVTATPTMLEVPLHSVSANSTMMTRTVLVLPPRARRKEASKSRSRFVAKLANTNLRMKAIPTTLVVPSERGGFAGLSVDSGSLLQTVKTNRWMAWTRRSPRKLVCTDLMMTATRTIQVVPRNSGRRSML